MAKYFTFIAFLLPAFFQSLTFGKISNQDAQIIFRHGSRNSENFNNDEAAFMARAINPNTMMDFNLDSYGCYCHFNQNMMDINNLKGQPVDEYDMVCKQLFDNYKCMEVDRSKENNNFSTQDKHPRSNPTCTPWDQEYNIQDVLQRLRNKFNQDINKMFSSEATKEICDEVFPHSSNLCKNQACKAEIYFVLSLVILESKLPYNIDPKFMRSNGFDSEKMCSKVDPHKLPYKILEDPNRDDEPSSTSCCGDYPNRRPFTETEFRGCCGGKTFNVFLHQCCEGRIRFGECD